MGMDFRMQLSKATHLHENGSAFHARFLEFPLMPTSLPGDLTGALRLTEAAVAELRRTS
jgi:hypothetical protein